MATEQAIQQVRDEIEREKSKGAVGVTNGACLVIANKLQWCLDLLTADAPDAVAALPALWRREGRICQRDATVSETVIEVTGLKARASALSQCADELEAAMKGER